jgi:hypothetical protein
MSKKNEKKGEPAAGGKDERTQFGKDIEVRSNPTYAVTLNLQTAIRVKTEADRRGKEVGVFLAEFLEEYARDEWRTETEDSSYRGARPRSRRGVSLMAEASIPIDTLDFLCEHLRLYIVDDGLVSGTFKLRCQDCPRKFERNLGVARRRPR